MSKYCIQVDDKEFHLTEIEFYKEGEACTYKRVWEEGRLFYHYSGIDIMRKYGDENWGVLVRSVEGDGTFIGGPLKLKDALLNKEEIRFW